MIYTESLGPKRRLPLLPQAFWSYFVGKRGRHRFHQHESELPQGRKYLYWIPRARVFVLLCQSYKWNRVIALVPRNTLSTPYRYFMKYRHEWVPPHLALLQVPRRLQWMGTPENAPTPPTPTLYSWFTRNQGRFAFLPRNTPPTPYRVILHVSPSTPHGVILDDVSL